MYRLLACALIVMCTVATTYAQVQPIPSPPNNVPNPNSPSSAKLSGSAQKGQKADINANFGGFKTGKNPRGPSSAVVGRDGAGGTSAKTGKGAEFHTKKSSSNTVTYGADNLPSGRTPNGGANFDKNTGVGGGTFTGKAERVSKLKYTKDSQSQPTVNLDANNVNGVATGVNGATNGKQKYGFKDSRNDNFNVNPSSSDGLQGGIDSKPVSGKGAGQFKYETTGSKSKTGQSTASLQDAQPAAGRSSFNWVCNGDGTGPSTCKNAKGETVGSVKKDDQGHTLVYNNKGTVIGRGSVSKGSNSKTYVVDVGQSAGTAKTARAATSKAANPNSGLYLAQVDNWSSTDCYGELNKNAANPYKDAIKVQKPFKFVYNQNAAGQYNYPDCFKIGGQVWIGPGLNASELAVEFRARVNPVGDLKCSDKGTCGRECYYCDMCSSNSVRFRESNTNTASNACKQGSGKEGAWYDVSATVCPPPDGSVPVCSTFERGTGYLADTKGDTVQAYMIFWKRPAKQTDLENNFFYRLKNEGDSFRSSVKLTGQSQALKSGNNVATSFSDFELKEIYVRNQLLATNSDYKEVMVSCTKGTTDYDLAGSKTSGNLLAEAGQLASKNGGIASNVYAKPACTPVADVQAADFANEQKAWVAAGSPKGSSGNPLSGLNLGSLG